MCATCTYGASVGCHRTTAANADGRRHRAPDLLVDLDAARYPHDVLIARAWQLRANLTAYDAVCVALAEALRAVLLTCDGRLARAPGHRARIERFA